MSDYAANTVRVEFEDGIAWVPMNHPEKRNAISAEMARWLAIAQPSSSLKCPSASHRTRRSATNFLINGPLIVSRPRIWEGSRSIGKLSRLTRSGSDLAHDHRHRLLRRRAAAILARMENQLQKSAFRPEIVG